MMEYLQEYLQRIREINEEYDLELRAEPGHYLMLVRNSDTSRDVAYLNDEEPYLSPNKVDIIKQEVLELTSDVLELDGE